MFARQGCCLDGIDDLGVAGAAAEVAGDGLAAAEPDLAVGQRGRAVHRATEPEQGFGLDRHSVQSAYTG